ncbi:unnamed protein product, partial [Brenthis ino]
MGLIRKSLILLCVLGLTYTQTTNQEYELAQKELEEYIQTAKKKVNEKWRPLYHVAPPVGWMNDPNGFSYHNGEYHLFYQYYPYKSEWGPMHWGHSSSPDLVNWKTLPTALLPEKEQCFSGSAVSEGNTMTLIYTGHEVTDVEPKYKESQYLAFSEDAVNFRKFEGNPVLSTTDSPDFRDPKVWKYKDNYYAVIGSKTNNQGRVLLYKSKDLKTWEFLSVLAESNGNLGYMWECPDFFELDGKFILLMSPQGVEPQGDRYKNIFQTGYIIGTFDYNTNKFIEEIPFQEIDFGHDYYAATTTEAYGKRYIVAWFAMWQTPHPEDVDGWVGTMTLVRELHLVNNKILQIPVEDIVKLRDNIAFEGEIKSNEVRNFGKAVELLIDSDLNQKVDLLLDGLEGGNSVSLRWDPAVRKVVVDRGSNDIRQVEWTPLGTHSWRVFLDASSLELFCGNGEVVFSSRVYPLGGWRLTNKSPQTIRVKAYNLKRSVPETSSSSWLWSHFAYGPFPYVLTITTLIFQILLSPCLSL